MKVYLFMNKKVDVILATDLIMHSTKRLNSHTCIVTTDSGFLPAIEIAQSEGVHITLFYNHIIPPHNQLLDTVDARRLIKRKIIDSIKRD